MTTWYYTWYYHRKSLATNISRVFITIGGVDDTHTVIQVNSSRFTRENSVQGILVFMLDNDHAIHIFYT